MLRVNSVFIAHVKRLVPDIIINHCMIHRKGLPSKTLPKEFQSVVLHTRIFLETCSEMDTSICRVYGDVPPARVYYLRTCILSGSTCLPIFLVGVLSGMLFPHGIQSQDVLIVFYVLSGWGSGSPGGTTPSILVRSAPGFSYQNLLFLHQSTLVVKRGCSETNLWHERRDHRTFTKPEERARSLSPWR